MTYRLTNDEIELKILSKLIHTAFGLGYSISVFDGGEETLTKSISSEEVFQAIRTTDKDTLSFYSPTEYVGRVWLYYGNGVDVIGDSTDNEKMIELLSPAMALSVELEDNA